MNTPPRLRHAPYWTLPAFVLGLSLPVTWCAGLFAVAVALRVTVILARRARARGIDRRAAAGPSALLALGRDERGRAVTLEERQLGAHGLIVGASGAGKSTTLLGILGQQIIRGRPVVALDLKGSPGFAQRLALAAQAAGRPLRIWTPDGPERWNPLAVGNATELKDKLIATERFTEPHYQRAAERYVQAAIATLHADGVRADLPAVVALMEPRRLSAAARRLETPFGDRVQDYLGELTRDQLSAVRGLGTRLALLTESAAGPFLSGAGAIDLRQALDGHEVVLFSLNSGRYGQLAAQLGTLAIQDLVSATGHRLETPLDGGTRAPATVAIDEFSALGSDQVLALLARGREAGVGVLLATQELSDLERAGRGFRDQVLGLTALKIAHRQDVPGSARTLAEMAGTETVWEETRAIRSPLAPATASRGTRRAVARLIVHPDEIARLPTGGAVLLTKTPVASVRRVRVDPAPSPPPPAPSPARHGRPGADRRDQPAPGVTR